MAPILMVKKRNYLDKVARCPYHTLFWVGAEGGVYFFWASGGGLRVGTGFDPEGGYRVGTVSKKNFFKWP